MSSLNSSGKDPESQANDESSGPNLTLFYALIVLALIAAIAVAAFIVFPFYVRR